MDVDESSETYWPLSSGQQGMLFNCSRHPDSTRYQLSRHWTVDGRLDIDILRAAWRAVTIHHPLLRARIVADGPRLAQRPGDPLILNVIKLPVPHNETITGIAAREARRSLAIDSGPLASCSVTVMGEGRYVLSVIVHHIIADPLSLMVLFDDLGQCYDALRTGDKPQLSVPGSSYRDFVLAQLQMVRSAAGQAKIDRIVSCVKESGYTALPSDARVEWDDTDNAGLVKIQLSRDNFADLKRISRACRATPYMLILSAFSVALSRYASRDSVLIGTSFAARQSETEDGVIGLFANILPTPVSNINDGSLRDHVIRVRDRCRELFECADVPYEAVVEALQGSGRQRDEPLIEATAQLHESPAALGGSLSLEGTCITPVPISNIGAHFALELNALVTAEGLDIELNYNAGKYKASTARCLAASTAKVLRSMASDLDSPLRALSLATDGVPVLAQARLTGRRTKGANGMLPATSMLRDIVARYPDRPAVRAWDGTLTFGELDKLSGQVAGALIARAPGKEIGIAISRSRHLLTGLLGIWKAGLAVVPLDLGGFRESLENSRGCHDVPIIIDPSAGESEIPVIQVRQLMEEGTGLAAAEAVQVSQASIAYIVPADNKEAAIALSYNNISYLTYAMDDILRKVVPNIRPPLAIAVNADIDTLAGLRQACTLFMGNCLSIVAPSARVKPAALAAELDRLGSQVADMSAAELVSYRQRVSPRTPGLAIALVPRADVRTAGEKVTGGDSPRVVATEGPAECAGLTLWTACYDDASGFEMPLPETDMRIVDHTRNVLPRGLDGEVCATGGGVGVGYVGEPRLTAERFGPAPWGPPGARSYLTGIGALVNVEGRLQAGRPVQGGRSTRRAADLAEVERAIVRHCPEVLKARVVLKQREQGQSVLEAFVVQATAAAFAPKIARLVLRDILPEYLLPERWYEVDSLDAAPGRAHSEIELVGREIDSSEDIAHPSDDLERMLHQVWQQSLGRTDFGVDDDFFDLGGNSLLALEVIGDLRYRLVRQIPLWQLSKHRTIAAMAKALRSGRQDRSERVWTATGVSPLAQPEKKLPTGPVLVTGAAGRIGSYVVAELISRGRKVRALVREESARDLWDHGPAELELIIGGLEDLRLLREAAAESADIIHLACTFGADRIDLDATSALASSLPAGQFVFMSTASVYNLRDGQGHGELTEEMAAEDNSSYGVMKLHCERAVLAAARQAQRGVSILRPPHVWGPDARFAEQLRWVDFPDVFECLEGGQAVRMPRTACLDGEHYGLNWIDSRDLATIACDALSTDGLGVINTCGGRIGKYELISRISESITGSKSVALVDDIPVESHADWNELPLSTSRFDGLYGSKPIRQWSDTFDVMLAALQAARVRQ